MRQSSGIQPSDKSLMVFDWDGTLMDSIGLIVASMHVAGQSQGLSTTDDEVKSIIGLSLIKGIELLYPQADPITQQRISAAYAEYYIAHCDDTPFFAGVTQMLDELVTQGRQLAVATGKKRIGLQRMLDSSDSHHYFVSSRCADEAGSKPDPNMLSEILVETNTTVAQAIFIGDSVHDISMANQLGMDSIAVSYGCETAKRLRQQQPSYQVDSVAELAALLLG